MSHPTSPDGEAEGRAMTDQPAAPTPGYRLTAYMKARRQTLGLTLDQVATRAGCTKSHIHDIENGRSRNPTVKMVCKLAGALEISAVKLFRLLAGFSDSAPAAERDRLKAMKEGLVKALESVEGQFGSTAHRYGCGCGGSNPPYDSCAETRRKVLAALAEARK